MYLAFQMMMVNEPSKHALCLCRYNSTNIAHIYVY
jgi:hypothetical protein